MEDTDSDPSRANDDESEAASGAAASSSGGLGLVVGLQARPMPNQTTRPNGNETACDHWEACWNCSRASLVALWQSVCPISPEPALFASCKTRVRQVEHALTR